VVLMLERLFFLVEEMRGQGEGVEWLGEQGDWRD